MRNFPAGITADDPVMVARSKYALSQFGFLSENCALLVNGHVAGGTAITVARRKFIRQFLRYQLVVQGAITSPQTQRGYIAFVHAKISCVSAASSILVGTVCSKALSMRRCWRTLSPRRPRSTSKMAARRRQPSRRLWMLSRIPGNAPTLALG